MKKILLIILLALLFLSCRAKKIYVETHSTDTIYKSEIIKITPAQVNSLVIESPCDSLGNLKPFMYAIGTGKNKVSLKTVKNTIYVEQNIDSLKEVWKNDYKSSTKTSVKEMVTFKTPAWNWKVIIVLIIIIFLETFYIIKKPF